jgi:hypothetical protein
MDSNIIEMKAGITILFVVVFILLGLRLWEDSIHNEENQPFVLETAFQLGIDPGEVTQKQFNARY